MQCSSPNNSLRLWLLCLMLLMPAFASAQQPFAREYWLNDAATPVRIHALVQDVAGYIWIGSEEGLYRFNGNVFVPFRGSVHAPVTALCASGADVWVGYKNGAIGKVEGDKYVSVIYTPAGDGKAITSIRSTSAGHAIATNEDQVLLLHGNGVVHSGADTGLPDGYLYSIIPLSAYRALLASDEGLTDISYNGKLWQKTQIGTSEGLPDAILRVIRPIRGTSLIWLGSQQGGIGLYSASAKAAWIPFYPGNWVWGQVNDIVPLSPIQAYAVTESGYFLELYLADSLHLTITPHYFPGKALRKILADKSGNLWCATTENLLKISTPYAAYMPLREPYALHQLTAIACDNNGRLWLAQDSLLLALRTDDTISRPELICGAPSSITSLFHDGWGRLWVGTLGNGVWYLPEGSSRLVPVSIDVLQWENILSIAGTIKSLWIASLSGVYEISYPDEQNVQQVVRHHTKASGMGTDYVYQIFPDSKGRIWMATDGAGVTMYDGRNYKRWDKELGSKVAYAITEDAQGNIWAATLAKGLYSFRAGAWKHYGREEGLQEMSISSLTSTRSGMVVAVNRQGIDQWYPGSRLFRHYNRRLGINIDSTSSALNCVARDAAGNVYVPFEHGIIKLCNDAAHFDIRPEVRVAQVALFMAPLPADRHLFSSGENYLSFFFDGLNYSNPEPIQYRYKLEGYNNNWIPTGDNRATFPELPPGKYIFRLQGSLNQHFSQTGEASYSFRIEPPLWRRLWFILSCLVLLGALAWYLLRLRDRSINNLLRLRQERLSFEYEHLKSQVNPHFLFNSLNTLTGLIEDGETEAATRYTEQLSDLYRNMLAYRDRDLILLSEEWDILAAYLHIQRSRFADAFQVNVGIPEHVLRTKRIVPMSLQLLVENAIKHNVVSKSSPLIINIHADENTITVSNQLQPKLSPQKGAGIGLGHIKRRYELLTNRKISFGPDKGHYEVSLPLL